MDDLMQDCSISIANTDTAALHEAIDIKDHFQSA